MIGVSGPATVGCSAPEQVLHCIRKAAEQATESKWTSSAPLWSLLQFLPLRPSRTDCNWWAEINPSKLILVRVLSQQPRIKWGLNLLSEGRILLGEADHTVFGKAVKAFWRFGVIKPIVRLHLLFCTRVWFCSSPSILKNPRKTEAGPGQVFRAQWTVCENLKK